MRSSIYLLLAYVLIVVALIVQITVKDYHLVSIILWAIVLLLQLGHWKHNPVDDE